MVLPKGSQAALQDRSSRRYPIVTGCRVMQASGVRLMLGTLWENGLPDESLRSDVMMRNETKAVKDKVP